VGLFPVGGGHGVSRASNVDHDIVKDDKGQTMILVALATRGHDVGKREPADEAVDGTIAESHAGGVAGELCQQRDAIGGGLQRHAVPLTLVGFQPGNDKPSVRTVSSNLGDGQRFDSRHDERTLVGMSAQHLFKRRTVGCRLDFGSQRAIDGRRKCEARIHVCSILRDHGSANRHQSGRKQCHTKITTQQFHRIPRVLKTPFYGSIGCRPVSPHVVRARHAAGGSSCLCRESCQVV
jgi:hypothetical protein